MKNEIFKNCDDEVEVVENSYEAMESYGFYWGYTEHEVTRDKVQQLLNGKILAVNNGEYATFIRLKESEEYHGKRSSSC